MIFEGTRVNTEHTCAANFDFMGFACSLPLSDAAEVIRSYGVGISQYYVDRDAIDAATSVC
jgi:hypothetical protein